MNADSIKDEANIDMFMDHVEVHFLDLNISSIMNDSKAYMSMNHFDLTKVILRMMVRLAFSWIRPNKKYCVSGNGSENFR